MEMTYNELLDRFLSAPFAEHEDICLEIMHSDADKDTKLTAMVIREMLLPANSIRRT